MIEKIVLDYLDNALTVDVYMERPENPPAKYVIAEKTSSSRVNHIDSATFAIQSYADSLYEAAELNESVKTAMDEIVSLVSIADSSLNSDYNFTDTSNKKYRYQAVYNLTHH